MSARTYTACQLCDQTLARDGRTVPPAVITVAGVRLCEGHAHNLIAIASENGVRIDDYLRRVA